MLVTRSAIYPISAMDPDSLALAIEYLNAPILDSDAISAWHALARDTERLYGSITQHITVQPIANAAPYADAYDMRDDVNANHRMLVSTLHCEHPIWTPEQNIMFRVVHDMSGHIWGKSDFSLAGEIAAYRAQRRWTSSDAKRALLVEVWAQSAACSYMGDFQVQKCYLPNV